jgi:hypothetical protein
MAGRFWTETEASIERPSDVELQDLFNDGLCEATDGCPVEPDGECAHGEPSWAIVLGLV